LKVRHHFGELNANIPSVVGNYDLLEPFVDKFDIPFHLVPTEDLDRERHGAKILKVLADYNPEVIVLARESFKKKKTSSNLPESLINPMANNVCHIEINRQEEHIQVNVEKEKCYD